MPKKTPAKRSGKLDSGRSQKRESSAVRKGDRAALLKELQIRDALFSSLAQATRELLANRDWSAAVGIGLKLIGEATKVERVFLFENNLSKEGTLTTSKRFEWNADATLSDAGRSKLQDLRYDQMEEIYEPLRSNRPYFQVVSKLELNSPFRKIVEDEASKSVLLFPIFVGDLFWGFMGFCERRYERKWSDIEISVLNAYAAMVSGSINRKQIESRMEMALHQALESEQRFRTLQEASFGGIGLHDKGVIIDCNQGLSDLTGYSYDELIGLNGLQLIAEADRALVMERIISGYDKPYDVMCLRKDGSKFAMEVQGKNIPYMGKTIRVTEFRDVTGRKKAKEKIQEQNARLANVASDLKRKNDQLEDFAQIVSHNLRGPIGNILSLISFYEETTSEKERTEYFNLLKTSSHAVHDTFNELVEVLKIRQYTDIERQTVSFATTFEKVRRMFSAKINETKAAVTSEFKVSKIHYPNIYLESILLNLLSNALKYRRKNITPEISFKTFEREGYTVLEVSDNGLGIDLEKYGHQVFKLNKTFHLHAEAKGIGLFITKNQVEAMGGEIKVFSKPNEGATFVVNFNKNARP
ncbi:MAG TPA: PAS domain S-box protein [Cyclobacteriaceae bacterium]|jgi:PAS domain S-box-containing protein|nr:PAS domain S-box protein [Cyclobacteriaceae bacterium]